MRPRLLAALAGVPLLCGALIPAAVSAAEPATAPTAPAAASAGGQVVPVSPDDTKDELLAKAASVTPSKRQLDWQREELTGFVHFGPNTYSGRDTGHGDEDPNLIQPKELDTDQWVSTFKKAGFKKVILTAKHHDGMLMFQSDYSKYGVASSSWQGGKGDIVKEFTDSAREQGLKVGLYLSPSDMHENLPGGTFGNGSPKKTSRIPTKGEGKSFTFEVDDYNRYYLNTLYELLTGYGTVDEVWFDGYDPTGGKQKYSFDDWFRMVRGLQPSASVFGGPDLRWVGNEDGYARTSEWSVVPAKGGTGPDEQRDPTFGYTEDDIAGDDRLTTASNHLAWFPAECDARLQPTWFWHPNQQPKSLAALEDMYFGSVGRNCQLLLNVGPNQLGRFGQTEVDRLTEFGDRIRSLFRTNVAEGASAANDSGTTSTEGNGPANVLDGDDTTAWQPSARTGSLTVDLGGAERFDTVLLQERIKTGQRVTSFAVDTWDGGQWHEATKATTIGYKRLLRLGEPVTSAKVRLRVLGSRATSPDIATLALYDGGSALNLAKGRPATQSSSTQANGEAAHATDGNTDGDFFNGSVSHTGSDTNAWWQTDLGGSASIGSIALWNRTDCCADRLSDYWVLVSDKPFDNTLTPEQQAAEPGVWSSHRTAQAGSPTTLTVGESGRYVKVQRVGTGPLSLAEVQVFGPKDDFTLTAEQPMSSVPPGGSTTSAITTSVAKGSPGTIELSVTGLPAGTTGTFEPTTVQAGGSAKLTLRTSADTPPGDYTLHVIGKTAEATHSGQITFNVKSTG
ncbi:alpha-L-fucosidase [Streptomyces sp. NA04227]|uniref:alpha-L-fucosidase n=1 Tax=Streptomyces sp. NA04227 TaxID=2742136 RepID=UPI0015911387|nr:alpha-L-fucosidase [Streptomyces sp. NA04227]QKW07529.1 alpha-L-fucosidase [Streptomyces sp. NA04227]